MKIMSLFRGNASVRAWSGKWGFLILIFLISYYCRQGDLLPLEEKRVRISIRMGHQNAFMLQKHQIYVSRNIKAF
jgi:hypothetical protein